MNGINAIVIIIIASFAIDRIVMGLLFILSFIRPWSRVFPDPETVDEQAKRVAAEKKLKLIRFSFAAVLGILVLAGYGHIRIFEEMGFEKINPILDTIVTGLILVAGADRLGAILKMPGAPGVEKAEPRPIEISGRLILESERAASEKQ